MPDADFWHPAASRSVCAWRTWPQITPPGSNNKLQDLRKGYFTTTSEAIAKRHKVAMERYRMFRRTFEATSPGARSAPKSTRCKRHVTELGKRRSTTQPISCSTLFYRNCRAERAGSPDNGRVTRAAIKSVRTYETSENFTAFFCGKANSNGLEAAISPPVRPVICILTIRVT